MRLSTAALPAAVLVGFAVSMASAADTAKAKDLPKLKANQVLVKVTGMH